MMQTFCDADGEAWEVREYSGFPGDIRFAGAHIWVETGDMVLRNAESGKVTAYSAEAWAEKLALGEFKPAA